MKTIAQLKLELCEKYRRMAGLTKSAPRRKNLLNKALSYRLQAVKLGLPK